MGVRSSSALANLGGNPKKGPLCATTTSGLFYADHTRTTCSQRRTLVCRQHEKSLGGRLDCSLSETNDGPYRPRFCIRRGKEIIRSVATGTLCRVRVHRILQRRSKDESYSGGIMRTGSGDRDCVGPLFRCCARTKDSPAQERKRRGSNLFRPSGFLFFRQLFPEALFVNEGEIRGGVFLNFPFLLRCL